MSADLAEELSRQTRDLVSRFEVRADGFRGRGDLTKLLVRGDNAAADRFAEELFGRGEFVATGIDGSMDFDERLQMILFYSNATAYSCPFTVGPHLRFDLAAARREVKLAASAAVPLWAEDLTSVISREPEVDIELEHSMERIPNSFMTLGETYLAHKACDQARVVFLDRPLSGTYSTLARDARNLIKRGGSRLVDWDGSHRVSELDIYLAVNLGSPSFAVPSRGRFLQLAILRALAEGPMSLAEVSRNLGLGEQEAKRGVRGIRKIDSDHGGALLDNSSDSRLKLRDEVPGYWRRASELALAYAGEVFSGKRHPLAMAGEQYLTILDVNTMAFVLLQEACRRAREKGVLLIGVAKDTTATDIARAVLPFASSAGEVALSSPPPKLKNDRAFLAILSSENPSVTTPWRTTGYDSAFSTMVDIGGELRSARQYVSRERLFVRAFFQLRTLKSDPSVKSQVFLFDRAYDERYDSQALRSFEVRERGGPSALSAYFEGSKGSGLSDLVLRILSLNDNPEVFEAYGHNQLLYLADKAVKAEVRMLRSSLRGVADLRVGGVSRRRKIFGLVTTYREQRAEAEHSRMRQ